MVHHLREHELAQVHRYLPRGSPAGWAGTVTAARFKSTTRRTADSEMLSMVYRERSA